MLDGGFDAWRAHGRPLATGLEETKPASFRQSEHGRRILVTMADMKAAVRDLSVVKLDVRDVDEWIGESSSPYGRDFCPRKGRIPGAVWLEWYRMMKPTPRGPRFKSRNEILAECATVGLRTDQQVIIYFFKGARASNTFVALEEAGFKNVRIYLGSWNEWSRDLSLPIEQRLPY